MNTAIPVEFITTGEAGVELLNGDSLLTELVNKWKASGGRRGPDAHLMKAEERQKALRASILDAVVERQIEPVALAGSLTDIKELRLTWDWRELPGELSLMSGRVRSASCEDRDLRQMDGRPLCFRRAHWHRWMANIGAASVLPAVNPTVAPAGNRAINDDLLVREVRQAKATGKAKSYLAASNLIDPNRLPGAGTIDSKRKRIAQKAREADLRGAPRL